MLVLLPSSEIKKRGGEVGSKLNLSKFIFPELTPERRMVVNLAEELARNVGASVKALSWSATRGSDVLTNQALKSSPVMPAVSRYVGVLYDALGAGSLLPSERRFLNDHALIHSAMFGPIRMFDLIPDYRLSASSSIPGLSLKAVWSKAIGAAISSTSDFIVDARSGAYARLGPLPHGRNCLRLEVLINGAGGLRTAPSYLSKRAKGKFARVIARAQELPAGPEDLVDWGIAHGLRFEILPRNAVSLVSEL